LIVLEGNKASIRRTLQALTVTWRNERTQRANRLRRRETSRSDPYLAP